MTLSLAFPPCTSLLDFRASLDEDGVLSINSEGKEPIWKTPHQQAACSMKENLKKAYNKTVPTKVVVVDGGLEVQMGDVVTWSSRHN